MAKSEVPNREETPLAEAVRVFPVEGNSCLFTATIAWDWCGAWAAHGGLLLALIHSTAKSYNLLTNPSNPQPDILNSHIQFLTPVLTGSSIQLVVRPLKLGFRVSILQIELQTQKPPLDISPRAKDFLHPSPEWSTNTLGILTTGNLATAQGLSFPTRECIPKNEIPNRQTECEEVVHPDFFVKVAPVIEKFVASVLRDQENTMLSPRFGRCVKDIWYRRADGKRWDLESLGILCDLIEGAPANWSPNRLDLKVGVRYPTLCLSLEIKKDLSGEQWLFQRCRALKIENGRFDTLVYICDEEGDLVAVAKHVSLIVEGKLLAEKPEEVERVFKL